MQAHVFFWIMIVSCSLHLVEVIILSIDDAKRLFGKENSDMLLVGGILGLVANIVFAMVVTCLLTKNEETNLENDLADNPKPVAEFENSRRKTVLD